MVLQYTLRKLASLYSKDILSHIDITQILMELGTLEEGWKHQNYLINWIGKDSKRVELRNWLTNYRKR